MNAGIRTISGIRFLIDEITTFEQINTKIRKEQTMNNFKVLMNGIVKENPTFVLLLGMCPTLGTTSSAINGMGMGLATMFVLICSNVVISSIKNLIPDMVRIPAFIVVIASFVTLLQMIMQAYVPALYATLGLFIPYFLFLQSCFGHSAFLQSALSQLAGSHLPPQAALQAAESQACPQQS